MYSLSREGENFDCYMSKILYFDDLQKFGLLCKANSIYLECWKQRVSLKLFFPVENAQLRK